MFPVVYIVKPRKRLVPKQGNIERNSYINTTFETVHNSFSRLFGAVPKMVSYNGAIYVENEEENKPSY